MIELTETKVDSIAREENTNERINVMGKEDPNQRALWTKNKVQKKDATVAAETTRGGSAPRGRLHIARIATKMAICRGQFGVKSQKTKVENLLQEEMIGETEDYLPEEMIRETEFHLPEREMTYHQVEGCMISTTGMTPIINHPKKGRFYERNNSRKTEYKNKDDWRDDRGDSRYNRDENRFDDRGNRGNRGDRDRDDRDNYSSRYTKNERSYKMSYANVDIRSSIRSCNDAPRNKF